ncbi:MAG: UvrD-helicase domain-containing protein [Candidatus Marinimicrobia bacterium]|jgi:DNA helicase-2/ATP-dependent DNA helicase PcrA|nr:DNA helicase [Candidatus Neomarinimicrobiota bacterium]MDP6500814.1 UvrD-helicase domain-containing protein [Candidatus Neomarinimicrobiota bacterium]MDP6725854.1 UvrD-helicase domain-containing protein [Candidatus Neomarinimicrobiota bacterium]|tara:strand:- start:22791 stop:24959 length:2169 start_codon:yes stop_codon:yes gene_type:complete
MKNQKLNKVQKKAVEDVCNPVLIFAGAGSGKTRVLTHKIVHLIEKGLFKPEEILAVTFTNKAAEEMSKRVQSLLKQKNVSLNIGTFHSICSRLLRQEIHRLGFSKDFVIYDVQDQTALIRLVMDELNIARTYVDPKSVRNKISFYKNKLMDFEDAKRSARTVLDKTICDIFKKYQSSLKKNNALDFDDLLLFPLVLFEEFPDVLKKYQEKWKYILVDEYQDTNRPQFLFISSIATAHNQICVVGDDDQSIYGWRGADIRNILDFEKTFPGCEIYKLEQNYRSTQQILNAASAVVKNNEDRALKELKAMNGAGDRLGLLETNDEMEEADALISVLEKEIKMNKRTFSDFAVLYRTNAQSRALEDSLRRNGIPYKIIGGIRFYERKEVKDLLAYLQLLVNKQDTISLRRVINFPPRGIGLKTVDKCVQEAKKCKKELFDVLGDPSKMNIRGKQAEELKTFYEIMSKYNDLLDKLNAGELVRTLVDETGMLKHYKKQDTPEDQERINNINEVLNSVDEFMTRTPNAMLTDFLEEVSLLTGIDHWNDQENRVTLMTVHSAKGLEFPVVFLTGMEDGLFPLYNALQDKQELEEERRLFYVGLTRAKQNVFLLYANNRRRAGAEQFYGLVSRFIGEIPEDHLENINFSSALTRKVIGSKRGYSKMEVKRTVTVFDDFRVGDLVKHAIFGVGKIMALSGSGENQRVGVVFKDGLKKKLIVKFAKLKKVS